MPFTPWMLLTAESLNTVINEAIDQRMALINLPGVTHSTYDHIGSTSTTITIKDAAGNIEFIQGGAPGIATTVMGSDTNLRIDPHGYKLYIGQVIIADLITGKIIAMPEDLDEASKQFWAHLSKQCSAFLAMAVYARSSENREELTKAVLNKELDGMSHAREITAKDKEISNLKAEISELKDKLSRNRFTRME